MARRVQVALCAPRPLAGIGMLRACVCVTSIGGAHLFVISRFLPFGFP